jgi:hypothetical protein
LWRRTARLVHTFYPNRRRWKYFEPIYEALREAQHQSGRFKFYGYLAAVYQTYKEWKDWNLQKDGRAAFAAALDSPQEDRQPSQNFD